LIRKVGPTMPRFLVILLLLAVGCQDGQVPPGRSAAKAVDSPPGVVLLRYRVGSGSTEQRELGFLQTLENEYPDLKILKADVYAGTTPESSKQAMLDLLAEYGDLVTGVFAVCEANTDGVLRALEESKHAGKIRFVGMDPNPAILAGLKDGKLDGLVLQDPVQMGYVAVQTLLAHLRGEPVPPSISTGEYLATPETASNPELQPLLRPMRFSGTSFVPSDRVFTIGVVPKGSTHGFWDAVHAGTERAAEEAGNVVIRFESPLLEEDLEKQIEIVESMIAEKVDGLCIVPIDANALIPVVERAKEAGIPTVVFDSNLYDNGQLRVSYVATDNYTAGVLAARRLAEVLGYEPQKEPGGEKEGAAASDP
jgi:ABC-type sugar transport system substrate-binding protein